MPDENGVDITTEDEVVEVKVTAPPTVVSTPKPKPSDTDERVSKVQSQLDKVRSDYQKSTLTNAEFQKETTRLKGELEDMSRATQDSLSQIKTRDEENATLKARVAKAEYLLKNPDLVPYADILPTTGDIDEIEKKATVLRDTREADRAAYREQVKAGVAPATLTRTAGTVDSLKDIRARLTASFGNPKDFNRLVQEAAAQITK